MTVDPVHLDRLARALCDATVTVPAVSAHEALILRELKPADLIPAVRAAAYRLAARAVNRG